MIHFSSQQKQKGITLIETLVAFFVVTLVLLGIIRITLSNLEVETKAYHQSIATMRADALFERLRDNWTVPAAQASLIEWNAINQQVLPFGHGDYSCNLQTKRCTVRVTWVAAGKQAYAVSMRLPHAIGLVNTKRLANPAVQGVEIQ